MQIVTINQVQTNFSQLLKKTLRGEEVVIAKAGKPVAKLVAYSDDFNEEDTAIYSLSEKVLAADWGRQEEEEAWKSLQ